MFAYFFLAALILIALTVGGVLVYKKRAPQRRMMSGDIRFRMYFVNGRNTLAEGRIPHDLRRAFVNIAESAAATGELCVLRDGELVFSENIRRGVQERFRNTYMLSQGSHRYGNGH